MVGLKQKGKFMSAEDLVYHMVCYIETHSVKELMQLVLTAINKADLLKKSETVVLKTK